MDTVLYRATSGSQLEFVKQGITANNLANINTPGFKADLFQAQLTHSQSSNGEKESYAVEGERGIDFSDGPVMQTGRELDVAIQGEGWFVVKDGKGQEGYTRGGAFQLNENGMLTTASGKPILGDGGPISIPPAKKIQIGSDGTISIIPLGGKSKALAAIDRIKLVKGNPSDWTKGEEGLMRSKSNKPSESDASIKVITGALEGSNVNAIDQMVNMIECGRQFDAQMKMMDTVNQNGQKLAQLLQE